MSKLYIEQKILSLSGKFDVYTSDKKMKYYVQGSFMRIPKQFQIFNALNEEIAVVQKDIFTLLPKFTLLVDGKEAAVIRKEFTFFKPKYSIDAAGLEIVGDWWDLSFEILHNGEVVGRIQKKWMKIADTYEVECFNEEIEPLIISIVIAIDCVKASDSSGISIGGVID